MAMVNCNRCGQKRNGLDEAPFKNEMGEKIVQQVCEVCWQEWVGQQLMLMNEYHLDPMNDEHNQYLDSEMVKFLNMK